MQISVIVPLYNAERFVGKCIESVKAQSYTDWQLILVDDGSKDRSLEVCRQYADQDNRIQVIHQENAGPGIARNTGIAQASGDYVVFVDSDDYIEPEYFRLLSHHDEDVVFIDVNDVNESGQVVRKEWMSSYKHLSKDSFLRCQMTGNIPWGGVRKCLKISVLRENNIRYTKHKIGEEALYSYQVLYYAKSIGFIEQPVYNYVLRGDSQSHLKIDNAWCDVAIALRDKVRSMGVYEEYADTLNAFVLTAAAGYAKNIATNHSVSDYCLKTKDVTLWQTENLDKGFPVDKKSMSVKAKVVSMLLRYRLFGLIWLLSKGRNMIT